MKVLNACELFAEYGLQLVEVQRDRDVLGEHLTEFLGELQQHTLHVSLVEYELHNLLIGEQRLKEVKLVGDGQQVIFQLLILHKDQIGGTQALRSHDHVSEVEGDDERVLVDAVVGPLELKHLVVFTLCGLVVGDTALTTRELHIHGADDLHEGFGSQQILVQDRTQHLTQHAPSLQHPLDVLEEAAIMQLQTSYIGLHDLLHEGLRIELPDVIMFAIDTYG